MLQKSIHQNSIITSTNDTIGSIYHISNAIIASSDKEKCLGIFLKKGKLNFQMTRDFLSSSTYSIEMALR